MMYKVDNAATLFRSLVGGFVRKCKCSERRLRSGLKVDSLSAVLSLTHRVRTLCLYIHDATLWSSDRVYNSVYR